jgi:hypothetical protein
MFPFLFKRIHYQNLQGYKARFHKKTKQFYAQDENRNSYGKRTLTLTDTGIIEKTAFGESTVKWEGIEKIAIEEDYIFIYLTATSALVIRNESIKGNTPQEFEKRLISMAEEFVTEKKAVAPNA